jgi:peptidoglycan LD-endopeptidase CwlK
MMASRSLLDLRKDVREMAIAMMSLCQANGIDLLIYCTWRSNVEQAIEYAKGRTSPGKIVTWAKPGQSKHNHVDEKGHPQSLAFDCAPLRHGKLVWSTLGNGLDNDPTDDDTDDLELWERVGAIGEEVGLEWAGRWKKFREFPHFQAKD